MLKLLFSINFLLLICIFHHEIVLGDSVCKCMDENDCADDAVEGVMVPKIAPQCPGNQICCVFKKKTKPADENDNKNNNIDDPNFDENCGIRINQRNGVNNDRKDGEAKLGEFPWTVTILRNNSVECGGSLITPSIVLTAAHCVYGKSKHLLKIRAGDWDLSKTKKSFRHETRRIKQTIIHEQFFHRLLINDIALIVLIKPFELNSFINTICLPPTDNDFDMTKCISCGFGKVSLKSNTYPKRLKMIDNLSIVQTDECQAALLENSNMPKEFNLHKSFTCAISGENKDVCKGDGGSPLICPTKNNPDQYNQVGIVSWGIGCGVENVPGVYVKVTEFYKWINEQLESVGESQNNYYFKAVLSDIGSNDDNDDNNANDYNE